MRCKLVSPLAERVRRQVQDDGLVFVALDREGVLVIATPYNTQVARDGAVVVGCIPKTSYTVAQSEK